MRCDDVVRLVVDHEVGAGGARELRLLRRTHGGDDARAAPFRELHAIVADRAGAAGDQHGLVLDGTGMKQAHPGGHAGDAERRAFGERDVGGQRRDEIFVERDVFGGGAEGAAVALAVVEPDAIAFLEALRAGADLVDDAGAVAVGDHARVFHRIGRAAAAIGVRRIDAGGFELDAHLALTRGRCRHVAVVEHFARRTCLVVPDCFHRFPRNSAFAVSTSPMVERSTGCAKRSRSGKRTASLRCAYGERGAGGAQRLDAAQHFQN